MKITYDKLLQSMQNAFFEESGENPDLLSDLGTRLKVVASELFNLACYSDFALKQAFVQTATGEYLDLHASMRNMTRKTASKAYGEITFYLAEVSETDVEIPSGTVCSVEGSEFIQFQTTESAVITAGSESVTVPAEALEIGSDYNAKAGTVTVLVNPPGYINRIENEFDFIGGYDDESDEALRKRLMSSYSVPPTGLSAKSVAECVMKIDEVLDCNIVKRSVNTVDVYVRTKSDAVSGELEDEIENALLFAYITLANVSVSLAERREYSLKISLTPLEGDGEDVAEAIRNAVKGYTSSIRIGESVSLSEIYHIVSDTAKVRDCTVACEDAQNGKIPGVEDAYLTPSEITVVCYE